MKKKTPLAHNNTIIKSTGQPADRMNRLPRAHLDRVVWCHLDLGRGQVQQTIRRGGGDDRVHDEYEVQHHNGILRLANSYIIMI